MSRREDVVQVILKTLSWQYNDGSPLNVLFWFDHEFNSGEWSEIEERLEFLYHRVQRQRRYAQAREAAEEWEEAATRWEQ